MNNNQNNGCNCNCNPAPSPENNPVDINMHVCDRNINVLPMLQTYTTKVLKPNICCKKNTLTQEMLSCEGYKYVIKWDFDLNGKTITVPNNCILEFDGGTLKNGTIIGQDTFYSDEGGLGDEVIFGEGIIKEGTWRKNEGGGSVEQIQSDWNQTNTQAKDYTKNKPTIPEAQVQSDWNQVDDTKKDFIKNKPTIPTEQKQADWNQTNTNEADFIKNKPEVPSIEGLASEEYVRDYTYDKQTIDRKVAEGGTFDPTNYYNKHDIDASQQAQDEVIALKAPQETTYTKEEVDNLIEGAGGNPDKPYDPTKHSGLGRKTLELKEGGSNVLTQEDFNQGNTIYVIQNDFDLNGQEIQVPAGCVLDFKGGSVNNGILHLNSATLDGYPKGDALYGVGYKDGEALMNTYKPNIGVSSAYDFAFLHYDSSILYQGTSPQSITVTNDYVIICGNQENTQAGLLELFDRNFNFIGQAYIGGLEHGGATTIADNTMYFVGTIGVKYAALDSIVTACRNSSKNNIPTVPTQTLDFEYSNRVLFGIDYDANVKEFAMLYNAGTKYTCVSIFDKNFNLKRAFDIDVRDTVTEGHNDPSEENPAPGYFGDIAYRNGVIVTSFVYIYGYTIQCTLRSSYFQIDANTGKVTSFLGNYDRGTSAEECEGICFDPEDDDVLWVTFHEFYNAQTFNRTNTEVIGRVSFTKKIKSFILPNGKAEPSVYHNGAITTIYVDNSYTGFSTGNQHCPFKTLETALLMTKCYGNKVRFVIKATNTPYSLGRIGIGNYIIFEGIKDGDNKPVIKNGIYYVYGGNLVMQNVTLIYNSSSSSAVIEVYDKGLLTTNGVDIYSKEDPSQITSANAYNAIKLDSGDITIKGTLNCIGFEVAINFINGGSLKYIDSINIRYCNEAYHFTNPGNIADGAISAITSDSTVSTYYRLDNNSHTLPTIIERIPFNIADDEVAIEQYAKTTMAKCMNNPGLVVFKTNGKGEEHRGEYVYTSKYGLRRTTDNFLNKPNDNTNLIIGTSYLSVINDSGIRTTFNHNWRKVGALAVPTVTDVNIPLYQTVKKGLLFTAANQQIAKELSAHPESGWFTFSFLAKGYGSIAGIFHFKFKDDSELTRGSTFAISSDEWIPCYYTCFVSNLSSDWALLKFGSTTITDNEGGIIIAACKVEISSFSSGWTPNPSEFPLGGPTSERPIGINVGYQYFDTTLNKTIVYNGTTWVNINGTPLT